MKRSRTVISILSAIVLLMLCLLPAGAAAEDKTPIILIPGFGQSYTDVYDENGEYIGNLSTMDFFNDIDVNGIIEQIGGTGLLTVLSRQDAGFTDQLRAFMNDFLKPFKLNSDGTPPGRREVKVFDKPFSQLSYADQAEVSRHVSFDGLQGFDDIRYYYTYDTFGSIKEAADGLHNYLHEYVLPQTGADKVIFVPISHGGAVFAEYLEYYPEDHEYIKKIITVVPAYNGSEILSDVLLDNVTVYDIEDLHKNVLPALLGELLPDPETAYQISLALNVAMTPSMQKKVIEVALDELKQIMVVNSTAMWALCPAEFYEQARDIYLAGSEHDKVRAEADGYSLARKNLVSNLRELMASGVIYHSAVGYDCTMFLGELFKSSVHDSDDLLNPSGASIGAVCADSGKTLGDGYVQQIPSAHNYLSPDGKLDASTAAFPDNTWFFKGIRHRFLNLRDDAKNFIAELIINDSITDVWSYPGKTQFIDFGAASAYTEPSADGRFIYHYDADGNYLYYESVEEAKPVKVFSFWKILDKIVNFLYFDLFPKLKLSLWN